MREMTYDDFEKKYGKRRFDLALRKIRKQKMSKFEKAELRTLESIMDQLLPPPTPTPIELLCAMADTHRILGDLEKKRTRKRNGQK